MSVRIYSLSREFDWTAWLCDAALARWLAAGWQIRGKTADAPHSLTCDDRLEHGCCDNGVFGAPLTDGTIAAAPIN